MTFYPIMLSVGAMAGFLSGLFGIGGGIIVMPLLVLIYPVLAEHTLPIATITGLSAVQGFFSSTMAFALHRGNFKPDWSIIKHFAIPMACANFIASMLAAAVDEASILFIFATLGIASLLVTYGVRRPVASMIENPTLWLPGVGLMTGALCGLVGQGGGFIYLPILISVFGLQIKQAISTSALIGIIAAGGALLGRLDTVSGFAAYAGELVAGVVLGGYLGAAVSHRLKPQQLKRILNLFIILCSLELMSRAVFNLG